MGIEHRIRFQDGSERCTCAIGHDHNEFENPTAKNTLEERVTRLEHYLGHV